MEYSEHTANRCVKLKINNSSDALRHTQPEGFLHLLGGSSYCRDVRMETTSGSETSNRRWIVSVSLIVMLQK